MFWTVLGLLARLAVTARALAFWRTSCPRRIVIIGEEMAQARRAEAARPPGLKNAPSPLPTDLRYDYWLGDLNLSDPVERPLDRELSALCQRFAASDLPTQSRLRDTASMDDFYTLLSYGQRSAVFAMRDRRVERVRDGLTAIAIIELSRIDFRDALVALALLYHAAVTIGEQPNELLQKAATLAESKMSELIVGFLARSDDQRELHQWGYTVIETNRGVGLVGWDFQRYEPICALHQIGLSLGKLVEQDKYGPARVTLASQLPAIWLSLVDDNALRRALASVRGVARINAELRPEASQDFRSQTITMFLVEVDEERAAESLLQLARKKQTRANSFSIAAAKQSRLFCLAIARSVVIGTASFETQTGLQRFAIGMAEILRNQVV